MLSFGGSGSDQGYGNVSVVRGCHQINIEQIPSCIDHITMNCTIGNCSLGNWIGSRPHKIPGAYVQSRVGSWRAV